MLRFAIFLTLAHTILGDLSPNAPHEKRSSDVVRPQVVRVPLSVATRDGEPCLPSQMTLFKFSRRRRAKCNDYSPAGYYLRRRPSSSKWVIYLPGGWYCSNEMSCKSRAMREPDLVSSNDWETCKERSGIMSSRMENNPHLYDANMVYVPYCSSDMWTGKAMRYRFGNDSFSFMGSVIIEEVFRHLVSHRGMRDATSILLTGSSAGGTGVLMNIDRIQELLTNLGVDVQIRGVADSAWYLLRPEMNEEIQCSGVYCPQVAQLAKGVAVWQANIPAGCRQSHATITSNHAYATPNDESWKCFFGHVIYPFVKAPIFVAQWMFDEYQMQADDADLFGRRREAGFYLSYIRNLSIEIRSQLEQVDAVFSPSCIDHAILERRDWTSVYVSDVNLSTAINCWLESLDEAQADTNKTSSDNSALEGYQQEPDLAGLYQNVDNDDCANESSLDPWYESTPTKCVYRAIDKCCIPQKNRSCQQLFGHTNVDILEFLDIDVNGLVRRSGFGTRAEFFKAFCGG